MFPMSLSCATVLFVWTTDAIKKIFANRFLARSIYDDRYMDSEMSSDMGQADTWVEDLHVSTP